MSRSAPSSQSGTAGPPKEMLPAGHGWVRSPNHSDIYDELRARQRARVATARQVRGERSDRRSRRVLGALHRERERVHPIGGRSVRRPGELRRGLGPTLPAGRRRVDDRDDPHRALGRGRVIRDGANPCRVRANLIGDARVLVEHLLPRGRVRCTRRRGARERDDDGVDRAGFARDRVELLGCRCEAGGRLLGARHALEASCGEGIGNRSAPGRAVGENDATAGSGDGCGLRVVERGPDARVPAAVGSLRGLGGYEHGRSERVEEVRQRLDVVGAHDLEQPWRHHPRDLGAVGEHDLALAPRREPVAREVGTDRAQVLGGRDGAERQRHTTGGRVAAARVPGPRLSRQGAEHHAGGGDRRQRVDRDAVGDLLPDAPGEGGDRALRAAVRPGVGGPPS